LKYYSTFRATSVISDATPKARNVVTECRGQPTHHPWRVRPPVAVEYALPPSETCELNLRANREHEHFPIPFESPPHRRIAILQEEHHCQMGAPLGASGRSGRYTRTRTRPVEPYGRSRGI